MPFFRALQLNKNNNYYHHHHYHHRQKVLRMRIERQNAHPHHSLSPHPGASYPTCQCGRLYWVAWGRLIDVHVSLADGEMHSGSRLRKTCPRCNKVQQQQRPPASRARLPHVHLSVSPPPCAPHPAPFPSLPHLTTRRRAVHRQEQFNFRTAQVGIH